MGRRTPVPLLPSCLGAVRSRASSSLPLVPFMLSGNNATQAPLQLFIWGKASHQEAGRQYYDSFSLNNHEYKIGDTVCLHPDNEGLQPYLGQIDSCYTQTEQVGTGAGTDNAANPQHQMHCIQVRWFERLVNLDPRCRGTERERELVELTETDINPIGCISCKATVFKTSSYEEALKMAKASKCEAQWYFCRGVYHQDSNQLVPYTKEQLSVFQMEPHRRNNRPRAASAMLEDVADSEDRRSNKRARQQSVPQLQPQDTQRLGSTSMHPAMVPSTAMSVPVSGEPAAEVTHSGTNVNPCAAVTATAGSAGASAPPAGGRRRAGHHGAAAAAAARVASNANGAATAAANAAGANSGRACVECGATQTPQWREGPAGPKTLCNACGVRYGRQQNRAGKRCGGAGVSRNAAQLSGARTGSGSKQAGSSSNGTKGNRQAQSAFEPMAQGRPIRQAAVLAANRTAEFARTGLYPEHADLFAGAPAGMPLMPVAGPAAPGALIPGMPAAAPTPTADGLDFSLPAAMPPIATMAGAGAAQRPYSSSPSSMSHKQLARQAHGQESGAMGPGGHPLKAEGGMENVGVLAGGHLAALPPQQLTSRESSHNSAESVQEVLGSMEGFADVAKRMDLDFTSAGVGIDCTTPLMPRLEALKADPDAADHTDGALLPCDLSGLSFLKPQDGALLGSPRGLLGLSTGFTPCPDAELAPSPTLAYASAAAAGSSAALLSAANTAAAAHMPALLPADSTAAALGSLLDLPPLKEDAGDASKAASNCDAARRSKSVDLRQVAARAAQWVPSIAKYSGVLSCIDEVSEQLPAPLVESLLNLGQAVDQAASEAAAAHAALAAVQQVLVARQEAAARARSDAVAAVTRLRSMVADLVDKHPQLALHGNLHCQPDMDPCSALLGLDDLDSMPSGVLLQPCDAGVPVGLSEGLDGYDSMLGTHSMAHAHAALHAHAHGPADLEDLVSMEDAAILGAHSRW